MLLARTRLSVAALALVWLPSATFAKDYFITIGGGPNPFNNQISLERNVIFSQRVLEQQRSDKPFRKVFFADGKIDKPDIQWKDPSVQRTPAMLWLTRLFGDVDSMNYHYRNHQVNEVDGPTRKAHLKQQFLELGEKLESGDRLVVYVTGHGSGPDTSDLYGEEYYGGESSYERYSEYMEDYNEYDTTIALWGDGTLSVSEFDQWLNKFSPNVQVVLVMAQCHSGGFAHTIFHHGDRSRGLNPQMRIGFFSQMHDRAAAGCTPEIDESTYQEYSTFFWESFAGVSRTGEPVTSCDFDGDGTVSFDEAHAHAVITSETIDIPITSSQAFLRRFSKIPPIEKESETGQENSGGLLGALFGGGKKSDADVTKRQDDESEKPLSRAATVGQLSGLSRPSQRAVIDALCKRLKVKSETKVSQVRRRANKLQEASDSATQLWAAASAVVQAERALISGSVALQWPALKTGSFSPMMVEMLQNQADAFVTYVEELPQADAYLQAVERAEKLQKQMERADNREAAMRRLLVTLEAIVLEHNLPFHANAKQQAHFETMLHAEAGGIAAVTQ